MYILYYNLYIYFCNSVTPHTISYVLKRVFILVIYKSFNKQNIHIMYATQPRPSPKRHFLSCLHAGFRTV